MKANLRTTFDRCGQVVTGHIEDTEMYEDVKSGKKWWRDGLYSQITHIRVPKDVFDRLLELDRKGSEEVMNDETQSDKS